MTDDPVWDVDQSHIADYNGTRRAYAMRVSTSQALRKRALEGQSAQNGHDTAKAAEEIYRRRDTP